MALRKLVVFDNTEGFPTDVIGADDFDVGSRKLSNVADPSAATDAVNLQTLQQYVQGLAWKAPVRAATTAALPANTYNNGASGVGATLTGNANGALTAQDGVTLVVGNRLLVKNEAAPENNGIYVVTQVGDGSNPYILTRATDADIAAELLNAAVFVSEGTTQADYAFVGTANAPITVGTTALPFTVFSSLVTYSFAQGLLDTAGVITVELDTAANAQGAGAGGGSSGLEFDVNTAAGKLRMAVNATGGLQRTGTGAAILPDPRANTTGNNPTLATAAAGATVLRSPKIEDNYIASAAIAVADPVNWSGTNNQVKKSNAAVDADSRVIGVARTAAANAAETLAVVSHGPCPGVLSGATVNTPYYLQSGGGIGTALPGGGTRTIQVGKAMNATDLWVQIIDFGKKA
jgi:hypothetical protein